MSFAKRHNKGGIKWDINTDTFKFVKLSELDRNTVYGIDGLFINTKSTYGAHPVAIVGSLEMLVDLPQHLTDEVKDILANDDDVNDIMNGRVGFEIYSYTPEGRKNTAYSINWVDM